MCMHIYTTMKQIRFLLEDDEYKAVMVSKGGYSWREWVILKAKNEVLK